MVTQLKKTKSLVRNLFLTKVTRDNIIPYQEHINEVFSDPNKYFLTDFYSSKVVIGRNHRKKAKNSEITTTSRLSPSMINFNSNKSRRNSLAGKINSIALPNYKSQHLPPNKYYINDSDVSNIYERFKEIKIRHEMDNEGNTFGERKIKQHSSHHQRNALENYSKYETDNKIVTNIIANKAKRNVHSLLMKNINVFRMKREHREKSSDESNKKQQMTLNDWVLNLKNKEDQHYINAGTRDNPKWHIIVTKKNKSEILRDPKEENEEGREGERENKDKQYNKKPIFTQTNSFNRKPFNSSIVNFQKAAESLKFKGLCIKGNDLLSIEYNNVKRMKRRKIITKNPKSEDSNESERVFINHYNHFSKCSFR